MKSSRPVFTNPASTSVTKSRLGVFAALAVPAVASAYVVAHVVKHGNEPSLVDSQSSNDLGPLRYIGTR